MNEKELYMDADWTPAEREIAQRNQRAMDYSDECRRNRRNWTRKVDAFVQRCLVASVGIFIWACVLALLVGAFYE